VKRLLSSDHFSVDGTLIEAWCSMKSFRPKEESDADGPGPDGPIGRNAEVNFRGEKRSNETHASTTDPDALLYRKSPAPAPGCVTWGMSSWRTGTAWSSMPRPRVFLDMPSGLRRWK
jgi:hypothetical protein